MASVLTGILKDPQVQQTLISELLKLITGWLHRTPAPTVPVVTPTPVPVQPPGFPDDIIPAPTPTRSVATVRLKRSRGQYNRERFPKEYTDDNPMGLISQDDLKGTIPFASKVWYDLTAYDAKGNEFLRDAVLSHNLAFQTELHVGDAFIIGHGAEQDGSPTPGYEAVDSDAIGNGITAWKSSLGFLHQIKAHGEGTFEVWGRVGGVESNHEILKVS